jgi:hypothetical protein
LILKASDKYTEVISPLIDEVYRQEVELEKLKAALNYGNTALDIFKETLFQLGEAQDDISYNKRHHHTVYASSGTNEHIHNSHAGAYAAKLALDRLREQLVDLNMFSPIYAPAIEIDRGAYMVNSPWTASLHHSQIAESERSVKEKIDAVQKIMVSLAVKESDLRMKLVENKVEIDSIIKNAHD